MKEFLLYLLKDVLKNHTFLLMATVLFLMGEYADAAFFLVAAFYFKLDDIRSSLDEGADIGSITINLPPKEVKE